MSEEAKPKKLNLDPVADKDIIEERIVKRIEERMPEATHDEVVEAVHEEYEDMLDHAKITQYIPSLTEKKAREDIREHHKHDAEEATLAAQEEE